MRRLVVVALLAAVSAAVLFVVRGSLAQARSSLENARAARDHAWNQYLLSEQRSSAADILIVGLDPFGVARAVDHTRGAFNAISAAAGEPMSARTGTLLGPVDQALGDTPLARDLLQGRLAAYNELRREISPLQGKALENVRAYKPERERLEERIAWLTYLETGAFLLTIACAFLLNVLTAKRR